MRLLTAATLVLAPFVSLRGQTSSILHLPNKTIEVVGLERWTVQMIQDSLDRYSPGDSLQSDACAAVLRYKLHFADASASVYPAGLTGPNEYVFVAVVEPQDSARVKYRVVRQDTTPPLPQWHDFVRFTAKHFGALEMGVLVYSPNSQGHDTLPSFARRDSAAVSHVVSFIRFHNSRADESLARGVLAVDRNVLNRSVAAAILVNFDDDSTVLSLFAALREQDGLAKRIAMQTLTTWSTHHSRLIDWNAAAPDIHAILDGTSLFALDQIMGILLRSGVDSSLARPFLQHGGRAVLAFAGAEQPMTRSSALAFLRAISGRDYGTDVDRWRAWVQSL